MNSIYRKYTLILLFSFIGFMGYCQDDDEASFYLGEVSKMANVPNSPEAQAFSKYGDVKVNMYAGVPQISIALHAIEGREMSVPFSLSYDASGIQVEQAATMVGLSWNLGVGGRISRSQNGLPDDYIFGIYQTMFNNNQLAATTQSYIDNTANLFNPTFDEAADARAYLEFLYQVNMNDFDTQQDFFTLNVMGLNETIVFEKLGNANIPRVLNNPRIKVIANLSATGYVASWRVIGEDGTQYFFNETEITERLNDNDEAPQGDLLGDIGLTTYVSSWLLTRVISKNSKDDFVFTYKDEGLQPNIQFASSAGTATTNIYNNIFDYSNPPLSPPSGVTSNVQQKFLTSVSHNGNLMATVNFGMRSDLLESNSNTRLASIDFFDDIGDDFKSITFQNNDYFNLDGVAISAIGSSNKSYADVRLKLNGLEIKGKDDNTYQTYGFEYERADDLPSRASYAQDYFGYYNGANGNSNLYTKYESSGLRFAGADREPDSYSGRTGILRKVTYPTKGHTTYTYESHEEHQTLSNDSEDFVLVSSLNASSVTDPSLYTDANGNLCDDAFLGQDPKIVIKTFRVFEGDTYNLTYTATGNSEAYIVNGDGNNGFSNYCDFISQPNLWTAISPETTTINLAPGKYSSLLIIGEVPLTGNYGNAFLGVSRGITTYNKRNVQVGGHRIARITDYSAPGKVAMTKVYSYNDADDESTGTINYKPILFDTREGSTQNGISTQLIRYGTYPKGNEPYVVYTTVTEQKLDANDIPLGKTTFHYHTGLKGVVPNLAAPYENRHIPNIKVGEVIEKVTSNDADEELARETIDFYETISRPIKIKGLVVYTEEDHFGKTPFIRINGPVGNEYYTIDFVETYSCEGGVASPTIGGVLCPVPDYYINPGDYGYHSYMDPKYAPYRGRVNFANGAYGGVSMTKTETYFKDDQNNIITVSTEENSQYIEEGVDPPVDWPYLPIKKRTTDSKGEIYETSYTYPTTANPPISDLVNKNDLVEVVQTTTVKNPDATTPDPISSRENNYQIISGNIVLPTLIKTTKGTSAVDNRVEFDFYSNGNLRTSKMAGGVSTAYIWGYDQKYPVAKIEDVTYAQIAAHVSVLNNLSNNDNDRTIDIRDANGNTVTYVGQEGDLREALNTLRINLPKTMVTSYTYDPSIGVTSMTDPRGYTIYYTYDAFHRLEEVKDSDGNIVTDYDYHYKGQTN